jgi:transposase
MYYYKPSPVDCRKAEDALTKLQDRLAGTLDALKVKGIAPDRVAIGFADESAVQFLCNNARFWCTDAHKPRPCNSEAGSQKFFGFYALVGESVLTRMEKGDAYNVQRALKTVREANRGYDAVVMIWDNAKSHKSADDFAALLGVHTVFLPPYSPDLNPVERVWKHCKRAVNEAGYFKEPEALATAFEQAFDSAKVQLSFAAGWAEKMQSTVSWIYPTESGVCP